MKPVDPKNRAAWTRFVFNAVTAAVEGLSVRTRVLIVAHAALESGWGQASSAMKAGSNNLFNLTAGPAWKGPTVAGGDKDGAGKPITQQWRVYPNYASAISDYWSFLGPDQNRGRYLKARAALAAGEARTFANELYFAHYYELDPVAYTSQLIGVNTAVSKLLGVSV